MDEYVFILYNEKYLIWQFCCKSKNPYVDGQKFIEKYNEENDYREDFTAKSVHFCTLSEWITGLRIRGKKYVQEKRGDS